MLGTPELAWRIKPSRLTDGCITLSLVRSNMAAAPPNIITKSIPDIVLLLQHRHQLPFGRPPSSQRCRPEYFTRLANSFWLHCHILSNRGGQLMESKIGPTEGTAMGPQKVQLIGLACS